MNVYQITYREKTGDSSSTIHMLVDKDVLVEDIFKRDYPTCEIVDITQRDKIDHLVINPKHLW